MANIEVISKSIDKTTTNGSILINGDAAYESITAVTGDGTPRIYVATHGDVTFAVTSEIFESISGGVGSGTALTADTVINSGKVLYYQFKITGTFTDVTDDADIRKIYVDMGTKGIAEITNTAETKDVGYGVGSATFDNNNVTVATGNIVTVELGDGVATINDTTPDFYLLIKVTTDKTKTA